MPTATRPSLVLAGTLLALCAAPLALAGDVEKAEHRRLSEDMEKKAQRNVWAGVERDFQLLLELQKKGEVLTYEDWYLGAQAARGLGNMADCRDRLVSAAAVQATDEVKTWISEIDATYVQVTLRSADKDNPPTLTFEGALFATDQRLAVEGAQAKLAAERTYTGLLPQGSYVLAAGPASQPFTLTVGQAPVEVKLGGGGGGREGGGGALAYVGPRIDLGPSFTLGGAPAEGAVAPTQLRGAGGRMAAGLEIGLTRSLGVGVGVGYHNLLSPGGEAALGPSSIHLGFGQVGLSYRVKDLRVSVNGQYGAGVGQVANMTMAEYTAMDCTGGNENPLCGVYDGETYAGAQDLPVAMKGQLLMGGANASVGYALFDLGKSLTGGLSLSGGAMGDGDRMYPWGSVAFTIAPVPSQE